MSIFLRSDLIGFYDWPVNGEQKPALQGEPDESPFKRTCGFEVLYMIRALMTEQNLSSIDAGQEIEIMIKVAPFDLRTQKEVRDWILNN